jgi:hypothetical protein
MPSFGIAARVTDESIAALAELRRGGHFEWYSVNLLAFVVYVYASAIRRREWDMVTLGLGFWALELVWEIMNALVLHFSGHAALWTVAKKSVLLIYVGLNLEIALMFAVVPIVLFHLLPKERTLRILGIPNRLLIPIVFGLFCVGVEVVLAKTGALVWSWAFWRAPHVWLICLAYCGPFAGLVWLYDNLNLRRKRQGMIGAMLLAAGAHLVFANLLGWV